MGKTNGIPEHLAPKKAEVATDKNKFYDDGQQGTKVHHVDGVRHDITRDIQELMNHVNQQPLSVGLLVSSAPLIFQGCALPSWFWAPEPGQGPRAVDTSGDINASVTGNGKKPACLRMAMHLHLNNITDSRKSDKNNILDQVQHPMESENSSDALKYILERYNALSWLTADPGSSGNRRSCLPAHVCILLRLYRCLDLLHDLAGVQAVKRKVST